MVLGVEKRSSSAIYSWRPANGELFTKTTLFDKQANWLRTGIKLAKISIVSRASHVFLCHYNELGVQLAAILIRLARKRVYLLLDSKFDDRPRSVWREALKAVWILPYCGAIVGSKRSRQYLQFMGLSDAKIENYYDAISVERIRRSAGVLPAPLGTDFDERHFTIIARLVPKKNLFAAVDAYALYASRINDPRRLRIFGDGELDQELRDHIQELGLSESIALEGFQQTEDISRALGTTLVLLHFSSEEQFGIAIIEALAMGVPVIVSENCGARDEFVRSGVNGFVVEPDNIEGIAFFLAKMSSDRSLWERFSAATTAFAEKADAVSFARSVKRLTTGN